MAQLVKNPLAMQETWLWSLGWEAPLEKGKATHSILAWRSPWTIVHGVTKSWTRLSDLHVHFRFHFRTWLLNRVVVQVMCMSCEEHWRKEEGEDLRRVIAVHQLGTRLGPISFNLWPSGSFPTEKCGLVKRKLIVTWKFPCMWLVAFLLVLLRVSL